jgi:hypothetical protein
VVRLPTGRSGVGLTDSDELWVVPFDLGIGGPRLGSEHGASFGPWLVSVRPSVGVRTTLRRASVRLEPAVSYRAGAVLLSAELALDARLVRQLELLPEGAAHRPAFDRWQSQLLLACDAGEHVRAKLRLPLRDRGTSLRWGSGSLAWVVTGRRVHAAAGVGMLVGRPRDQYTLDAYRWFFWLPYPELDLAVRF